MDPAKQARRLFAGIASRYETPANFLSFGGFGRWRRFAVRQLRVDFSAAQDQAGRRPRLLDVATGTGLVAHEIRQRYGAQVIGVDLTPEMLGFAQSRGLAVVAARAEQLPFRSEGFDAVVFSYLLRYVGDPTQTLAEIIRVLRPGGVMVSIEFGIPQNRILRALWTVYTFTVFRWITGTISAGWRDIGRFLGPSIVEFCRRAPVERLREIWTSQGMTDVQIRTMTFGAGVVMWGRKDGQLFTR